jgi:peptidyl-prolyl cis-trans isomerase SurA
MNRNVTKLLIALFVCLIQLFLARPSFSEVVDRIVAEVNDEIITMSELQNMAKGYEAKLGVKPTPREDKELQRKMLDALIDRKLARAEAKKRGIELTEKEKTEAMARFMRRNHLSDEEALKKALSQAGITMQEVKQQLFDQLIQERLLAATVGSKVTVREEDVRKAYDELAREDAGGAARLHILTAKLPFPPGATEAQKAEIKQKAEMIIKDTQAGTPLLEVARKYSAEGTDMGFMALEDINPTLASHLSQAKPKDVVPVETPGGFQFFQLVERRAGHIPSYEEAAPRIRDILLQKDLSKHFDEWVKGLRAKAHIKIML